MEVKPATVVNLYSNTVIPYHQASVSLGSFYNYSQQASLALLARAYQKVEAMIRLCLGRRLSNKRRPTSHTATTTEMNYPINLCDAHASDIGALSRVHVTAFSRDSFIRLMYDECSHWKAITTMLESLHVQTNCIFQIALAGNEKRMAGWICCTVVKTSTSTEDDPLAHHEWASALALVVNEMQDELTKTSGMGEDVDQRQQRHRLWEVASRNSTDAQISAMRDQKYLVLNTIVTDPAFTHRGIASELLGWAGRYADEGRLRTWAQVSPAAASIFTKAGYEEVAIMGIDLGNFCKGDRSDAGQDLDICEFKFMLREPQRQSKK